MMRCNLLSLVLSSIIAVLTIPCNGAGSYVTTLSDEDFESVTQAATGQTTGKWFVNFYSKDSGCSQCKRLEPIWEDFAKEITEEYHGVGVLIANVCIEENPKLMERFNIKSTPKLLFFADQKMFDYKYSRNLADLIDFALYSYESEDSTTVPTEPPLWQLLLELLKMKVNELRNYLNNVKENIQGHAEFKALENDLKHIYLLRKNAACVLIFVGALFGLKILSAVFLVSVLCLRQVRAHREVQMLWRDLEHIYALRKNAAATIFIIGILFGVIIMKAISLYGRKKKATVSAVKKEKTL